MTSQDHHNADKPAEAGAASEETKKKFLEALENKKNQQHGSVGSASGAKINHSQGAASHKREFRRKSG